MTTATYSLARPASIAAPRGAVLIGWLFDLAVALRRQRQLKRAAQANDRAAKRVARDAAALRRWAQRLQESDPRLAADLRAAADRSTA